jgi:hypothetical protein
MADFVNDNVALPEPKNEQTVPLGKEARFIRGQDFNALRDAALSLRTARTADVAAQATKNSQLDTALANETSARQGGDAAERAYVNTMLAGIGAPEANAARITAQETHTSGWVNVRSYGAKGDGVTDDTAAVQAMLAALGAAPRTIVVDGPCVVNANLTIPAIQPVRMEGNGAFVGTGVVTYQPWGVIGASAPTVRRLSGVLAQDFSAGTYAAGGNATGPTVTLDARGAQRLAFTQAAGNQYVSLVADGTWDFSTSDVFGVDVEWEREDRPNAIVVILSSDVSLTSFANYAQLTVGAGPKPPRSMLTLRKSAMTVTGSPNWAAIKHVQIRHMRYSAGTSPASAVYLYGLWSHLQAKTKVMVTFDDAVSSLYDGIFPIMRAAGLRGTSYLNALSVGTSGYATVAQLREMYAGGWDVASHGYSHLSLAYRPTTYTSSGTAATFVLPSTQPHGKAPGGAVTIAGATEAAYNGTFTILTTPDAYTMTWTLGSTPLMPSVEGLPYIVGMPSDATVANEIQRNVDWLVAKGFHRSAQHFAYPYGNYSAGTTAVIDDIVSTARLTSALATPSQSMIAAHDGLRSPLHLNSMDAMNSTSTAAATLAKVDEAIALGIDVSLFGHGIAASSPSSTQMLTAQFQALVDGLKTRRDAGQIDVVTISEWFNRL